MDNPFSSSERRRAAITPAEAVLLLPLAVAGIGLITELLGSMKRGKPIDRSSEPK